MRWLSTVGLLVAITGLPSDAGAGEFDPHAQPRLFAVRDTSSARNAIDEAQALLAKGRVASALREIQKVLDERPDDFYLDESLSVPASVVWRSAAEEARSMLDGLSPEARALYERMSEPAAAPLIRNALDLRDPSQLTQVQRRFGASRVGVKAGRLLAEIAYEAGRFHDAAGIARDTLRFARDHAPLWALYVDALVAAGDEGALDRLAPPKGIEVTVAGRSLPLDAYIAEKRPPKEGALVSRNRPMWGGDPTRTRPFPFESPHPKSLRWLEYTDWVERNRDRPTRFFREEFPHEKFRAMLVNFRPLMPAVKDRTVYVADGRSIRAFDLYSGRTLWRFDAARYRADEQPPFRMYQPGQPAEGRTSLERAFAPVVAGDMLIATVEERLEYHPDRLNRIEISMYLPRRRLVALDRHTGRLLWIAGDSARGKLAGIDQWSMIAPPVVAEGLVLSVGSVYDGSHSVVFTAFDLESGEPRWVRVLGTGQQELNLFGIPVKELAASAVSVADGVAYVSTGLGFVAAADLRTGAPRWLASYEIIPVEPVEYWYKAPLRIPIVAPNPPLAVDDVKVEFDGEVRTLDLLIVSPSDGKHIHAFDRATGELVWRAPLAPHKARSNMDWSVFVHVLGVASDGHRDVLLTTDTVVRARDLSTGETAWESQAEPLERGIVGAGAIAGGEVIVPTNFGLARFSISKEGSGEGQLPWPRGAEAGNVLPLDRVLLVTGRDTVQWFYDWEDLERDVARRRKERPDDPSILIEAGELYLRAAGQMDRARSAFTEALEIAERSAPSFIERARHGLYSAWRREGDLTRALPERSARAYQNALAFAQTAADRVALRIATLSVLRGNARRTTLRALIVEAGDEQAIFDGDEGPVPAAAKAALLLARDLHAAGKVEEAVDTLQDAMRRSGSHVIRGVTVRERARDGIAKIVAQVGPAPYARHEKRAVALLSQAKAEASSELFERLISEYPNSSALPQALLARGAVLIAEDRLDGAIASLTRVLSDYPRHRIAFRALALLARAYRAEGSFGAALGALERIPSNASFEMDGTRTTGAAFVVAERAALPPEAAPSSEREADEHQAPTVPIEESGYIPAGDDTNGRELAIMTQRRADGSRQDAPISVMLHGREMSVIDMKTGAVAWKHRTKSNVHRAAAVGGRLVLAITPKLHAFVAGTGESAWSYDVGGLVREVAISHGMLYAVVQDTQSIAGTSSLMAFDPYTGRRLWRFDLGPENPRRLRGWRDRVLLEKTRWDARQSVARLMVFDAFLGTLQHQMPIPIQTEASPVVAGDVFIVAHRKHVKTRFQRQLKAYDLLRGVERWRATLSGDVSVTGLIPDGDGVVVLQGDGHIRTFRSEDGEQIAVTKIAVEAGAHVRPFMQSRILLDETSITFLPAVRPPTAQAPSTPSLMSFDRETGKRLWERPFPAGVDLTAARLSAGGNTLTAVVSYRKSRAPHILIRLVNLRTGALLQDVEPDGLAQPRWVPTSQTGFGTLVVFGRAGASIWRGAKARER